MKQLIVGKVIDSVSKSPIPFANVYVTGFLGAIKEGTTTDFDGMFDLEYEKEDSIQPQCFSAPCPPIEQKINASFVGYDKQTKSLNGSSITFELSSNNKLSEVVFSSPKIRYGIVILSVLTIVGVTYLAIKYFK